MFNRCPHLSLACLADTNVLIKFQDISLKTTSVNIMAAKVIRIHPLGAMNICTNLHGDPSNDC